MDKSKINIIFEDEYILAVNKPAGILVVPTDYGREHTLTDLVSDLILSRGNDEKVYPCHRLDRDTSGVILFAKNRETEKKITDDFRQRRIKKKYIAIVSECPRKKYGVINKKIEGMEAITKYHVMKKKEGYSILEIEPITGRTNQIRIHLKLIGNPVLGERKFAFGKDFRIKFRRTALHARELTFLHPVTGKLVNLKAAIPEDMKKLI